MGNSIRQPAYDKASDQKIDHFINIVEFVSKILAYIGQLPVI